MIRFAGIAGIAAVFGSGLYSHADTNRTIEAAFEHVAFFNCLLFSRDGVPLSELAEESGLVKTESWDNDPPQSERWLVSDVRGALAVVARLDGTQSCTTMAKGISTGEAFSRTEKLLLSGLPESMRFESQRVERSSELETHHFKQIADVGLSATISLSLDTRTQNEDAAAIVSFYYSE